MGVQRDLRSGHEDAGHSLRVCRRYPAAPVHCRQFPLFAGRVVDQLGVLNIDLVLHELVVGLNRHQLPCCHRESAGEQSCHPGNSHGAAAGAGAGHPENERDIGEQPVLLRIT